MAPPAQAQVLAGPPAAGSPEDRVVSTSLVTGLLVLLVCIWSLVAHRIR